MTEQAPPLRKSSNAYSIFVFVLTIVSLVIMALMLLPLSQATLDLLKVYDNLICFIFLGDFFFNLLRAPKKSDYFIKDRGWLDLLGSIPSLGGVLRFSGLFRLARLSRLARIGRLMKGQGKAELLVDVLANRSQYTAFLTVLMAIIVLASTSVMVLQFESQSPEGKILTGNDAFWYSLVTITTVGYGDYYPVTLGGRITAMFIMVTGVGIIGVLASLMSSLLVGSASTPAEDETPAPIAATSPALENDIAEMKKELAAMRQLLESLAKNRDQ